MESFFTDKQWRWIKERYDEGYSMKSLADFLGINRRSIRTAFLRLGLYPETKAALPPLADRRQEFLSLRTEGLTQDSPVESETVLAFKQVGSAGRAPRSPN